MIPTQDLVPIINPANSILNSAVSTGIPVVTVHNPAEKQEIPFFFG